MPRPTRQARTTLAATILSVSLLAAGCSDDDDSDAGEADADPSATAAAPATAGAPSSDPDHPYCDIERRIDEHFETAFSGLGNEATEQQQATAAQSAAQAVVAAGLLEEADANAPDAIRTDLDVLIANVTAAADGNVEVFFTPESDQAGSRVDAFCGLSD